MRKIRKGDTVQILSGKDKGRVGTILQVLQVNTGLSVLVEGINMKKKHVKPNPQRQQRGGVIAREAFIPACKVALLDPVNNKPSRVGIRQLDDGRKVRYFKSSGEVVDV